MVAAWILGNHTAFEMGERVGNKRGAGDACLERETGKALAGIQLMAGESLSQRPRSAFRMLTANVPIRRITSQAAEARRKLMSTRQGSSDTEQKALTVMP
jgi:uncharacterized membrane protein